MMKKPRILVIDDEPQILRALYTILTANHYQVTSANRGEVGLAMAALENPDVIILDLGLPDMDGVTVCDRLREWTQTPVIILSVRDADRDKVQALDKGADDYLVKPFSSDELLARIRVALRHTVQARTNSAPVVQSAEVVIDLSRRVVTKAGLEVKLTAKEFDLLAYLASNPDRVLTHNAILEHVWGQEYINRMEYLRVFMSLLRKKLEDNPRKPKFLLSEPGVGYRFSIITLEQ